MSRHSYTDDMMGRVISANVFEGLRFVRVVCPDGYFDKHFVGEVILSGSTVRCPLRVSRLKDRL